MSKIIVEIELKDTPDTFFYVDPPYVSSADFDIAAKAIEEWNHNLRPESKV